MAGPFRVGDINGQRKFKGVFMSYSGGGGDGGRGIEPSKEG